MQNLTIQKVCLALITLAFFVAAPWLTSETLNGNAMPLTALGGVAVLLLFIYGLGDRCWLIIPFCLSIEGNLNFLPLNFSIQELAIVTLFCYLLFRMIFGMDVAWRPGPALIWLPLVGVFAVVVFHWISSGDIGIKLLGGTGWGGRRYFKVFIATLCIPLLASFPGMRMQDLQKIPFVFFMGSFVDIVPDILTTLVPATAPIIWRVYSAVNLGEYGASLHGNFTGEKAITRFGTLAKLGSALGLVTLCYFPARTWLQPNRLWAFPVVLLGGFLCAMSGFRNTIFRYALSVMAALYASLRFKSLILLPVVGAVAMAVALTQGKAFNYPLQIQRALSFLPGDWDFKAESESKGSNKWRQQIDELFYKEYFHKAPLLGQGYHFDPSLAKQETDIYLSLIKRQAAAGDEYREVRSFIEMRQPHQGPVHILLVTGVVGGVFFVLFCVSLLLYSFRSVIKTQPKQITPIQIWAVAMLVPEIFGFFVVFGDLTNFLIRVCPVALLLYRFERLKALAPVSPEPLAEMNSSVSAPELAWPPNPSWQPRQPPVS